MAAAAAGPALRRSLFILPSARPRRGRPPWPPALPPWALATAATAPRGAVRGGRVKKRRPAVKPQILARFGLRCGSSLTDIALG